MVPVNREAQREQKEEKKEEEKKEDMSEPKGDPAMAHLYLRRLLPIFTQVYQSTMLPSVRKASLALIRKMVHYMPADVLVQMTIIDTTTTFATTLVEVVAIVLDNEVSAQPVHL